MMSQEILSTGKTVRKCIRHGIKQKCTEIDVGKLRALRNAGWSLKKIGEELRVSEATVWNYLKKLEGQNADKRDDKQVAGNHGELSGSAGDACAHA